MTDFFLTVGRQEERAERDIQRRSHRESEFTEMISEVQRHLDDVFTQLQMGDRWNAQTGNLLKRVDQIHFSVRSQNFLLDRNIRFLYELVQLGEKEAMKTKNFGPKSLREIIEVMGGYGLEFGMELPPNLKDRYVPRA